MLPYILGGLMGLKGLFDANSEKKQKLAQATADATTMRFSPWSGINASGLVGKNYSSQNPLSGALAGGLSGASTGINIDNAMADSDFKKQISEHYKNKENLDLADSFPSPYKRLFKTPEQELEDTLYDKIGMKGFGQ